MGLSLYDAVLGVGLGVAVAVGCEAEEGKEGLSEGVRRPGGRILRRPVVAGFVFFSGRCGLFAESVCHLA